MIKKYLSSGWTWFVVAAFLLASVLSTENTFLMVLGLFALAVSTALAFFNFMESDL